MNPLIYRYPGIQPFKAEQKHLFYGRDDDYWTLRDLLDLKDRIVVYGKSGNGKSSFIHAKVIPELSLESDNLKVLPFTFKNYTNNHNGKKDIQSPIEELKKIIFEELDNSKTISYLPQDLLNIESLWLRLKQLQIQYAIERNDTLNPEISLKKKKENHSYHSYTFIFDQFESLFTYPKNEIENFSVQLAETLYSIVPVHYRDILSKIETSKINSDILEILLSKPIIKVIFIIREDRLSLFNSIKDRHPDILTNLLHLEPINEDDARRAIKMPAKQDGSFKSTKFYFYEDAINSIIEASRSKTDLKINSSTLQIICRYIEENIIEPKKGKEFDKNENGEYKITKDKLGDISTILSNYYTTEIKKIATLCKVSSEDIHEFLETKSFDNDLSIPIYQVKISEDLNINNEILTKLEKSSLLKKEKDSEDKTYYKLGHDLLIDFLKKERDEKERKKVNKRSWWFIIASIGIFSIALGLISYWNMLISENNFAIAKNDSLRVINTIALDSVCEHRRSLERLKGIIQRDTANLNSEIRNRYNSDLKMVNTLIKPPLLDFKRAIQILKVLNKRNDNATIKELYKKEIINRTEICKQMIPIQNHWETYKEKRISDSLTCALKQLRILTIEQSKLKNVNPKYFFKEDTIEIRDMISQYNTYYDNLPNDKKTDSIKVKKYIKINANCN